MMNLLKVPGKQEHHRVQQARQKPAEFNCLLEQSTEKEYLEYLQCRVKRNWAVLDSCSDLGRVH